MEYTTLGRTGLKVSVMGLGGGGHSRLGSGTGASVESSVAIVRRAIDLGVNFIDTAESYGTEPIIGDALRGLGRWKIVLSTKKTFARGDTLITADELQKGLEASLTRLQTDYLDIYHLHAVEAREYDYALNELAPVLQKMREAGKLRYIGITEQFAAEPGHAMLSRAIKDEPWDVVMVGFNLLNQSARERVLADAIRRNIGVLCMYAVRNALSRPQRLHEIMADLARNDQIETGKVDMNNPLGFVTEWEGVESVPDAAYRFCRAEPGLNVILSGTGNPDHLESNIESILKPPLPDGLHRELVDIFGRVDSVSGE